jgi:hypothetical protein
MGIMGFGARDVRFKRVGGSDEVAVLEAVSGTVRIRSSGGAGLELSLDEARKRLAEQSNGRVTSLRVVTVRGGGRWYVALLPTALEWSRLATTAGTADYARLTAAPTPGASSPEAAVSALALAAAHGRPLAELAPGLAPSERNAVDAYLPALSPALDKMSGDLLRGGHPPPLPDGMATVAVSGTSRVADGVVKVQLGGNPSWNVIAIRSGGTWYPSMVFTLTDATLTGAEREHS